MAAMVSPGVLALFEEDTGFLVTFALEIMPKIRRRVGRQLRGQSVQSREDGAQVGLDGSRGHLAGGLLQFHQRVENFVFRFCHNSIFQPPYYAAGAKINMAKRILT